MKHVGIEQSSSTYYNRQVETGWTVLISGLHLVYNICNLKFTVRTISGGHMLPIQEESSCFHCRLLCSLSAKVKKRGLDVIKSECYIEPPS